MRAMKGREGGREGGKGGREAREGREPWRDGGRHCACFGNLEEGPSGKKTITDFSGYVFDIFMEIAPKAGQAPHAFKKWMKQVNKIAAPSLPVA